MPQLKAKDTTTVMASTANFPHNPISPTTLSNGPIPPVHRIPWNVQSGKHILIPSSIEMSKAFLNRLGLIFVVPAIEPAHRYRFQTIRPLNPSHFEHLDILILDLSIYLHSCLSYVSYPYWVQFISPRLTSCSLFFLLPFLLPSSAPPSILIGM